MGLCICSNELSQVLQEGYVNVYTSQRNVKDRMKLINPFSAGFYLKKKKKTFLFLVNFHVKIRLLLKSYILLAVTIEG
jgi:hypothetical protein